MVKKDKYQKPSLLNKMVYRIISGKKLKTPKSSLVEKRKQLKKGATKRTKEVRDQLRRAGLSASDIARLRGK